MRNIEDYQQKYKREPFEEYQVLFRRKKVLELLEKYPHSNILEVGCGLEPLYTSVETFETMTIVEPASEFVRMAKRKQKKDGRRILCIQGFLEEKIDEIEKLEIKYDYIVVSSLLHEVEAPIKLLEAVSKICRENTVVHINVPNALSFHRMIAYEMGKIDTLYQRSEQQITMQRMRVYDIASLQTEVERQGFEVIEKGTYFPKFLTHAQMQQAMDAGIIDMHVLEGMYLLDKYIPQYGSEIYVQLRKKRNVRGV